MNEVLSMPQRCLVYLLNAVHRYALIKRIHPESLVFPSDYRSSIHSARSANH